MVRFVAWALFALILLVGGVLYWALFADSKASETAPDLFPVAEWRTLIDDADPTALPTAISLLEVSKDVSPGFAAQAGRFGIYWPTTYSAFEIDTPDGAIIVDGGIDEDTFDLMVVTPSEAAFYEDAYRALIDKMAQARAIVLTHEHVDHVMAISRHPDPEAIAPRLYLNAAQKPDLAQFARGGNLDPALISVEPRLPAAPQVIAPGVVVIPAPGHTDGSQVIFVRLQTGAEYLLIGDIVWTMSNLSDLTIRPVITQFIIFDPNEDRAAIKNQVRALHDLAAAEPDLILLPSHDRDYLMDLVAAGELDLAGPAN